MKNYIDYGKIFNAEKHYRYLNYRYIDAEWVVPKNTIEITKPKLSQHLYYDKNVPLIGSGEQYFIQLIMEGKLKEGRYVCMTPCFRDNAEDHMHSKYFFKVELINTENTSKDALVGMIDHANAFFNYYLKTKVVKQLTDHISYDITTNSGIELGSYGIRTHPKVGSWVYGTGCAEPRLTFGVLHEEGVV